MNKLFYTTVKLRIRPILSKLYSTAKMTDNNPASQNASAERWFHKWVTASELHVQIQFTFFILGMKMFLIRH